jgi:uncharacterized protein YcfL
MRNSLFLIPIALFALTGCDSNASLSPRASNTPSSERLANNYVPPDGAGIYMTPEESSDMVILPGDATTAIQDRYAAASNDIR